MNPLPVRLAYQLDQRPEDRRWLVEGLWGERAVGIVGGEPKSFKSWLALDVAVSVASGAPCLRCFSVTRPGPVLLFAAEDALHVVRERLDGICRAAGVSFARLGVHVITVPVVRLDLELDRLRLRETVEALRPRLLVLDPFVRLHRRDENVAGEVAPLLAYLRELERRLEAAVLLVHHARKGGHVRAGQALRGSSELHAWGDSNLYLRRSGEQVLLSIEHRAAASQRGLRLALQEQRGGLALGVVEDSDEEESDQGDRTSQPERVLQVLRDAEGVVSARRLRDACKMRNATLLQVLRTLVDDGRVARTPGGYRLQA